MSPNKFYIIVGGVGLAAVVVAAFFHVSNHSGAPSPVAGLGDPTVWLAGVAVEDAPVQPDREWDVPRGAGMKKVADSPTGSLIPVARPAQFHLSSESAAVFLPPQGSAPAPRGDRSPVLGSLPPPEPTPAAGGAVDMIVPRGVRLPAVLLTGDQDIQSLGQAHVAESMSEQFLRTAPAMEVVRAGEVASRKTLAGPDLARWRASTQLVDDRYRTIFGQDAFNRNSAAAAREALQDQ